MEQEKLAESKRTFEDDVEGYEKYLDNLRADVALIEEQVKDLMTEKNKKKEVIRDLNEQIHNQISECSKLDDQLAIYKNNMAFIMQIADFSKHKSNNLVEARRGSRFIVLDGDLSISNPDNDIQRTIDNSRGSAKMNKTQKEGNFFLTNLSQKFFDSKKNISMDTVSKSDARSNHTPIEIEKEDTFDIPFDKKSLMQLLVEIEEDNLSLMNQIQEDESNLDDITKQSKHAKKLIKNEIVKVSSNITALETTLNSMKSKQKLLITSESETMTVSISFDVAKWFTRLIQLIFCIDESIIAQSIELT